MTNPNQDSLLGGAQGMNWGKDPSPWMSSRERPVWRGGTVLEPITESQQRDFDKGTPLFWDDGGERKQLCAVVQTAERDGGEFDDGIRTIYIKKNGSAPGSMFGELKRAVAAAGGGLGPGCEVHFAMVGSEASKKRGGADRRLFICHFKPMPPAGDQMLQGPDPAQTQQPAPQYQPPAAPQQQGPPAGYAQQAPPNGQPQYQPAPQQQPQGPPPGYQPAPQQQPAYAQAGPPANGQASYQQGPPPGYAPQDATTQQQQYQSPAPPAQPQGPPAPPNGYPY